MSILMEKQEKPEAGGYIHEKKNEADVYTHGETRKPEADDGYTCESF